MELAPLLRRTIFVVGNQYSRYGAISHIEFLSENWVVDSLFKLALKRNTVEAKTLNRQMHFSAGYLHDKKWKEKTNIDDFMLIYDFPKTR